MDTMIKSRMIPLELENGEIVQLTLNFGKLLNVRAKRKDIYKRYNKVMMDGPEDVFDNVIIVYTAYLCGLDDIDNCKSEEEFTKLLPPYMQQVNNIVMDLTRPKKQTDSEEPSIQEEKPEDHNE